MVLPFGVSVGDFISVLQLVHDVSQALKKSAGSRADFMRLLDTFDHIETALKAVSALTAPDGFEDQLTAIKTAASQCGNVILAFLHRNESFHVTFSDRRSEKQWRAPLKKIKWRLYRKDDVDETRVQLQEHISTINLLINTFHITLTHRNTGCWDQRTTSLMRKFDDSDAQQHVLLNMVEQGKQQAKLLELLNNKLQLQEINNTPPPQVLMSKPVVLIDARGKPMPFFLESIQSQEAFLFILKERFDQAGAQRIEEDGYALEDITKKCDIDRKRPWTTWFKPDQRVNMGMIFLNSEESNNCCPQCERPSEQPADTEVKW